MPIRPHNITNDDWEKELQEWKARYRNLFSTPHGMRVLEDMLTELNFFQEVVTEEDRIKSNYAKRLAYLCGGWTFNLAKRSW